MVDIYRKRVGYNYRCLYWKRDRTHDLDNEEIVHFHTPSGVFYAKKVSSNTRNAQDVAGVFRVDYNRIIIETNDKVFIEKDDLIKIDNVIWIVDKATTEDLQKNNEFGVNSSKKTIIDLQRGR